MKPRGWLGFMVTGFLLLSAASAQQPVTGVAYWVEHNGVRISVWEKFVGSAAGKDVIVLAHGSATAGQESFDLHVKGKPSYSLMDSLARAGFDVFALDTRGFGRSTHPEEHITTYEASEDLNAVVDFVLERRSAEAVNLLGWSWGTQYGGMFVMAYPEKVEKYIAYAQMGINSPDIALRRPRVKIFQENPYIEIPEEGWKPRFYSITPDEVNDPEVVDAYARAAARVETRTATGPQLDMVTIMPMINPRLISVPTMIIHGEYDDVADFDGLTSFFEQLPNPYKRYVIVPNAGHMMHLQAGHELFQHEVVAFFKAPLD